jgi:glucokinase
MEILSIDIGGSSIKYGIIEVDQQSHFSIMFQGNPVTLESNLFADLENKVLGIADDMVSKYPSLKTIGICTTGSVNTNMIVRSAGHFRGYENISWKEILTTRFPTIDVVYTVNDGRSSTWAEYVADDSGSKSHIHVVLGTGVGGGIVYDDELLLGESGQAGYIGHMKLTSEDTIICSCKKRGCLEALASLRGIENSMRRRSNNSYGFETIIDLAKEEDLNAIESIREGGYWLGIGIGNCMNIINPGVVSIGGGVIEATTGLLQSLNDDIYFKSVLKGAEYSSHGRVFNSCSIKKAKYGNSGGIIGAALLSLKYRNASNLS